MSRKNINKYCRIFQWIEKNDSELAECIKDLCMEGALTPNKNINGITFLMPKINSTLRNNILRNAYESDGDADEAVKIIESLIIPDYIPTIEMMTMSGKEVGTKGSILLENPKAGKHSVEFKNGLKITPDLKSNFETLNRKGNLAIWLIESGEPPLSGPSYKPKNVKSKRTKSSKADGGDDSIDYTVRSDIAYKIENIYRAQIKDNIFPDTYIMAVLIILNHLKKYYNSDYIKLVPLFDIDPIITFYLIFEPYKKQRDCLISDDVIDDHVFMELSKVDSTEGTKLDGRDLIKDYNKHLSQQKDLLTDNKEISKKYLESSIFTNKSNLVKEITKIRENLMTNYNATINEEARNYYYTLEKENCIGNIKNVFPDNLHIHYKENTNKKIWQDEFRFLSRAYIYSMKNSKDISEKRNKFNILCNYIKLSASGNDYEKELSIMELLNMKKYVTINDKVQITKCFIESTDFLFVSENSDRKLICEMKDKLVKNDEIPKSPRNQEPLFKRTAYVTSDNEEDKPNRPSTAVSKSKPYMTSDDEEDKPSRSSTNISKSKQPTRPSTAPSKLTKERELTQSQKREEEEKRRILEDIKKQEIDIRRNDDKAFIAEENLPPGHSSYRHSDRHRLNEMNTNSIHVRPHRDEMDETNEDCKRLLDRIRKKLGRDKYNEMINEY
jgi:hypothetical protein